MEKDWADHVNAETVRLDGVVKRLGQSVSTGEFCELAEAVCKRLEALETMNGCLRAAVEKAGIAVPDGVHAVADKPRVVRFGVVG